MGNQNIKYFEKLINHVEHQNADEIFALAISKKHGYDTENETLLSTDNFFIEIIKMIYIKYINIICDIIKVIENLISIFR